MLRPSGHAFVAFLSRYAYLRRALLVSEERRHLLDDGFVRRLLEEGAFHNDVPGRFTHGFYRRLGYAAEENVSLGKRLET